MLAAWTALDGATDRLEAWSEATGMDLARLGTTAEAEEITDTAVTQPLVVAAALLAHRALVERDLLPTPMLTAGHSIGEVAAAAVAGVLTDDQAVRLAAVRGAAMARACAAAPTGMSAVLGGDEDEVLDRIAELGLEPANRNAKGQIVAAGALEDLAKLAETRRRRPGSAPCRSPAPSTPDTWSRPWPRSPRRPPRSPRPIRPCRFCPTPTAQCSPTVPRCCAAWSTRSPARCGGTCA